MRKRSLCFLSVVVASGCLLLGCDDRYTSSAEIEIEKKKPQAASATTTETTNAKNRNSSDQPNNSGRRNSGVPSENESEAGDQPSESMTQATWNQVNKLYQQAKESGQTSANNASQWLQDVWNSTSASGIEISRQSQDWLTSQYLKAKEAGTTSAGSATEYFQTEFAKMGTWEYAVTHSPFGLGQVHVQRMNEMGQDRWECFSTATDGQQVRLFYRRKVKSDFDNIPTRDLMRLVMALAGGGLISGGSE